MRRLIAILLVGLALGAPLVGLADAASDELAGQIAEELRRRAGLQPTDVELVDVLNARAALLYQNGKYAEAEQVTRVALEWGERLLGADHPNTLQTLNNLAAVYQAQGRYAEAEPLLRKVLAAHERTLGAEHPATLMSLNNLAGLYDVRGHYADAEPLYRRALAAMERTLGVEHPQTLGSLNNLAALYYFQGRYADAEPLLRRALAAMERTLGAEHPDTLTSLNNLAALYNAQGRYSEAEPLYRRALAASERTLGVEHPHTLTSLNNLATLYYAQGRYAEAEPLLRKAVAARERTLGVEHPDTLTSLNNLASLYDTQGRYGEAEPLYRRALTVRERMLGAEHPDTLTSLNNLAGLYKTQRRYGEAEPLLRRALAAMERTLGAEHPDTLTSLNTLANLHTIQGRYGEAEPLYRRALAARERTLGAEHPHTLASLSDLAHLYNTQGRYADAEPLARRALADSERTLGAEHPDTLTSLNNLAILYLAQGRYADAAPRFRRALGASERVLGLEHPDTIETHLSLAATLVNASKLAKGIRQLRAIDGRLRGFVSLQLATTGPEQVRRQRVNAEARLQDAVYTLALAHPDKKALPLAADLMLRWKRLAGEQEAQVARLARLSPDPRVKDFVGRLARARADFSRLVHLPKPDPKAITESRAELERLEVELATLSHIFASQRAARAPGWKSVRDALPPDSALLELRAYHPLDFKTGKGADPHWLALLIPADPAGGPRLRLFDLGPTAATAPLLERLRADDPTAEPLLYQPLFGPLDRVIAGYPTLFIAPDGALDLVPFAALKLPDGRYWIERQSLRTLRTGRDLLAPAPERQGAGMLAFGEIDYDRFPPAPPAQAPGRQATQAGAAPSDAASAPPAPTAPGAAAADPAPLLAATRALREARVRFAPLAQTGPEARQIGRMYEDEQHTEGLVLTRRDASERRLKALAEPPRVLHLATHGFFLPDPGDASAGALDRPMVLSGLALAGANRGLKGKQGADGENGILYALEAIDLNLEGTELVALSACDTGRGAVDRSEGVYGLVRAFQIAGARDVLMTLWRLDDPLARDFMEQFYRAWLDPDGGRSPAAALRQVQLAWIADGDARKRDPRHWAPYVLVERGRDLGPGARAAAAAR